MPAERFIGIKLRTNGIAGYSLNWMGMIYKLNPCLLLGLHLKIAAKRKKTTAIAGTSSSKN
ncbi:hypothetical protein A8C56_06255 [Niabella ginsenosidivorans]|uniref:Uncharacterized protein n=1 Tax=Niabella ginsenosidivorans TaxID=1176587 RepID=A0A1A9HZ03_9BACT|nr:hypothetical protein A8C56_06255 [Niabella ginsenosidivorans]